MIKDGKDKYLDALSGAESGKAIREHLKHSDFNDHLISVLKRDEEFSTLVLKVLVLSAPFWAWLFLVSLTISLLVVKFPMVAEWICSIIK